MSTSFVTTFRRLNLLMVFSGNPFLCFNTTFSIFQFQFLSISLLWNCLIIIMYAWLTFFDIADIIKNNHNLFNIITKALSTILVFCLVVNATSMNVFMRNRQLKIMNLFYKLDIVLKERFRHYDLLNQKHWYQIRKLIRLSLFHITLIVLFILFKFYCGFDRFRSFLSLFFNMFICFLASSMSFFGIFCASRLSQIFQLFQSELKNRTDVEPVLFIYDEIYKTYTKITKLFECFLLVNTVLSLFVQSLFLYTLPIYVSSYVGPFILAIIIPGVFQALPVYIHWGLVAEEVSMTNYIYFICCFERITLPS